MFPLYFFKGLSSRLEQTEIGLVTHILHSINIGLAFSAHKKIEERLREGTAG
jgi:hypothetical protein